MYFQTRIGVLSNPRHEVATSAGDLPVQTDFIKPFFAKEGLGFGVCQLVMDAGGLGLVLS